MSLFVALRRGNADQSFFRRQFAVLADEALRARFLDLAGDEGNTFMVRLSVLLSSRRQHRTLTFFLFIQLESCPPYQTRSAHRQPICFSRFAPATDTRHGGNVAQFETAASPPLPQFLPMEDGDIFSQNILSVHLRSVSKPKVDPSSVHDSTDGDEVVELASPLTPALFPQYDYSLSLASSLDRIFRDFFETSPSCSRASSPSPSPESTPPPSPSFSSSRPTRSHRLACSTNPSSRSALFAAQIECFQVESTSPPIYDSDGDSLLAYGGSPGSSWGSPVPGSRFGSPCAAPPRLFEYFFSTVEMDVGKVVVAAEEGLPGGGRTKTRLPSQADSAVLVF